MQSFSQTITHENANRFNKLMEHLQVNNFCRLKLNIFLISYKVEKMKFKQIGITHNTLWQMSTVELCNLLLIMSKHILDGKQTRLAYITLHYITLHYITLHYNTLHYITLHYITLHYITLHCIALHYITLCYIILH